MQSTPTPQQLRFYIPVKISIYIPLIQSQQKLNNTSFTSVICYVYHKVAATHYFDTTVDWENIHSPSLFAQFTML